MGSNANQGMGDFPAVLGEIVKFPAGTVKRVNFMTHSNSNTLGIRGHNTLADVFFDVSVTDTDINNFAQRRMSFTAGGQTFTIEDVRAPLRIRRDLRDLRLPFRAQHVRADGVEQAARHQDHQLQEGDRLLPAGAEQAELRSHGMKSASTSRAFRAPPIRPQTGAASPPARTRSWSRRDPRSACVSGSPHGSFKSYARAPSCLTESWD